MTLKSHIGRKDEFLYYQDALTDAVGASIKHDFKLEWLISQKKQYGWGTFTTSLLLIDQPSNVTPLHYDEQHTTLVGGVGLSWCVLGGCGRVGLG